MTNEDAIDVLKNDIEICTIQQKQACDMAIKALNVMQGIETAYMKELLKTPLERGVSISDPCDGCRYELNSTNGNPCYSCGKYKLTEQQPSVYPERQRGEWLHIYKSDIACECSRCHRQMPVTEYFHYCPNCGAEMSGGEEDGASN